MWFRSSAVDPVTGQLLSADPRLIDDCCCHASHFTAREVEVLSFVACGMTTGAIAARLRISKRTVEAHLASMLRRTGAHTRAQLVAISYVSGIFATDNWPPLPSGKCCLQHGPYRECG